jgi:hypothetical protein
MPLVTALGTIGREEEGSTSPSAALFPISATEAAGPERRQASATYTRLLLSNVRSVSPDMPGAQPGPRRVGFEYSVREVFRTR